MSRRVAAEGGVSRGRLDTAAAQPTRLKSWADLDDPLVAIPGERTTAFLLMQLALGHRPRTRLMRFNAIVDAVAKGEVDAGLIIHESRFTYQNAGWGEQPPADRIRVRALPRIAAIDNRASSTGSRRSSLS